MAGLAPNPMSLMTSAMPCWFGVCGALFIAFGVWMLYTVFKPGPDIAPVIQAAEPVADAEPDRLGE